jgi:hypothetical protein
MNEARGERADVAVTRIGLRHGGWIGYSDDAIFLDRGDDEGIKIAHDDVERLSLNILEWDLAVMSILLIGVGTFVAVTRNVVAGVAFGAVGAWSCYRTYAKRYELRIDVDGETTPLSVYPEEPGECHERLVDATGLERRNVGG